MHGYKLLEDNETLLVNSCFFDEEDFAYANKHRFNIKYTEVGSSGFAKDILKLQNCGYKFELKTEPDFAPDGLKLEDKIYAYFTHPDNDENEKINTNVINDERIIITEILNYLICLSRLVSPEQAKKYYGFNYDGANIDLFREIKNKFYSGNLNVDVILNNNLYKQIVHELDEMEGVLNG